VAEGKTAGQWQRHGLGQRLDNAEVVGDRGLMGDKRWAMEESSALSRFILMVVGRAALLRGHRQPNGRGAPRPYHIVSFGVPYHLNQP
jgi:hypothetical protein